MVPEMTSVQTDNVETRRKTKRNRDFGKGKKRDIKRNIPSDLIPIEEETWLLQPIAVTMMRHDYSLIQIRILVTIVEYMQSKLHKMLNKERLQPSEIPFPPTDDGWTAHSRPVPASIPERRTCGILKTVRRKSRRPHRYSARDF